MDYTKFALFLRIKKLRLRVENLLKVYAPLASSGEESLDQTLDKGTFWCPGAEVVVACGESRGADIRGTRMQRSRESEGGSP